MDLYWWGRGGLKRGGLKWVFTVCVILRHFVFCGLLYKYKGRDKAAVCCVTFSCVVVMQRGCTTSCCVVLCYDALCYAM